MVNCLRFKQGLTPLSIQMPTAARAEATQPTSIRRTAERTARIHPAKTRSTRTLQPMKSEKATALEKKSPKVTRPTAMRQPVTAVAAEATRPIRRSTAATLRAVMRPWATQSTTTALSVTRLGSMSLPAAMRRQMASLAMIQVA